MLERRLSGASVDTQTTRMPLFSASSISGVRLLGLPAVRIIPSTPAAASSLHADASAGPRHRKSARGKIRRVPDLPGNFEDVLARSYLNAAAPVQRAVNRANRYTGNLCNSLDSTELFSHRGGSYLGSSYASSGTTQARALRENLRRRYGLWILAKRRAHGSIARPLTYTRSVLSERSGSATFRKSRQT